MIAAIFVPVLSIIAQVNLQELRNNHAYLQRNINEARRNIADTNRQINEADREMDRIDEEMMQLLEDMLILDGDIAIVEERYEQSILELESARTYRDTQELIVHDRLRALHEHGQPNLLDVLVQSTSVRDFMLRMEWMTQITRQDQRMLQRLEEANERYLVIVEDAARLANTLKSLMVELERTAAELELLMEQWQERHGALMINRQTFEEMLAADQAQVRTVAQQIAREEERIAAAEAERRQREAAERAARLTGGSMLWPVPGFWSISSGYGNRPNPFNRRQIQFHTGIDIHGTGIMGAEVVAVQHGYVISAATGWNGGYGTVIMLQHANNYETRYAHLSRLLVTEGQEVHAGQVIGFVGSTGNSTGPHLHFEVRRNGNHVNPIGYLPR